MILERLCIPALMVVDRVRIGHQDRRFAECRKFRHSSGAGPAKDQVGAGIRLIHFLDERKHLRFERKRVISCFDRGKVRLAGLVNNLQSTCEIR